MKDLARELPTVLSKDPGLLSSLFRPKDRASIETKTELFASVVFCLGVSLCGLDVAIDDVDILPQTHSINPDIYAYSYGRFCSKSVQVFCMHLPEYCPI